MINFPAKRRQIPKYVPAPAGPLPKGDLRSELTQKRRLLLTGSGLSKSSTKLNSHPV